jgi:hypothetical protein
MKDQDVITRLVELHDHIHVPTTPAGEDTLRGERLVRRRRTVSFAAVAAAVVLTVGVRAGLPVGRRERAAANTCALVPGAVGSGRALAC